MIQSKEVILNQVKSNHLFVLILFFVLCSPLLAVNNLSVSGIAITTNANGTYEYQGLDGNGHNLWKHSTYTYYVYWNNNYSNWELDVDYTTDDYIAFDENGIALSEMPTASPSANVWAGNQDDIRVMVMEDAGATPVELTTFKANVIEDGVKLNWQTATEVNNYGFEVERQILNQVQNDTWESIAFVEGHGNSNSPKEYSFSDTDNISGLIKYRLKQIDIDGGFEYSDVIEVEINAAKEFKLAQNFPNPFNPTTKIDFSIPSDNNVEVKVFNTLGMEVATLVNGYKNAGTYSVEFNASNLSSGIYFYKIVSGNHSDIKKMILLR